MNGTLSKYVTLYAINHKHRRGRVIGREAAKFTYIYYCSIEVVQLHQIFAFVSIIQSNEYFLVVVCSFLSGL